MRILVIFILFSLTALPQDDLNNRFMLANSYEQTGEYQRAKGILEDLYKRQPGNYQFFEALNRVYLQLKNYDESEKLINGRLSINPDDINLYGLLGKTFYVRGEEDKAFRVWDEAIEKSRNNLSVYKMVAGYAVERRAFEKAIEILSRGKEKAPDPVIFAHDLANLYALTMNYRKAAEEYSQLLAAVPQEVHNVRSRMMGYINKPEALSQSLKVFEAAGNANYEIRTILAWLYTESKNFEAAYRLYSGFDKERGSSGNEIYNYAQLLFNLKEYETSARIFAEILEEYSSSPLLNAARLGYARSVEEQFRQDLLSDSSDWKPISRSVSYPGGEPDKLISIYRDLSEITSAGDLTNEARFRAASIYLNFKNDRGKAGEMFSEILENYPVSSFAAESALELAGICIKEGKLELASGYLERVLKLPRSTEDQKNRGRLMLAQVYFYRLEFDKSRDLLRRITSDLRDNSANDALELSLLLNAKMSDSLSLLAFAEAEFLSVREEFREAGDKYASISSEKGGFMLGSLAKIREAEIELALDNTGKAVELLEKIAAEESRNIYSDKALYLLGNIYEYGLRDHPGAVELYEKLLARFPSSLYLDEAREHILNLRKKLS